MFHHLATGTQFARVHCRWSSIAPIDYAARPPVPDRGIFIWACAAGVVLLAASLLVLAMLAYLAPVSRREGVAGLIFAVVAVAVLAMEFAAIMGRSRWATLAIAGIFALLMIPIIGNLKPPAVSIYNLGLCLSLVYVAGIVVGHWRWWLKLGNCLPRRELIKTCRRK